MADWEIKKSLGVCFGTGQDIQPGQDYYAALIETEEGFERRDFSIDYWDQQKPQTYCFWKAAMPHPDEKKKIFVDDDMLISFFERLEKETDPEKVNFRFVLTLILMRKRKLKYDSGKQINGQEVWTLRVTGEKTTTDVINPRLGEEQIEQLSSQIGQILHTDI